MGLALFYFEHTWVRDFLNPAPFVFIAILQREVSVMVKSTGTAIFVPGLNAIAFCVWMESRRKDIVRRTERPTSYELPGNFKA